MARHFSGLPGTDRSGIVRFRWQATQRPSGESGGTSQLQPVASALGQARQRSSGRAFGAKLPSSCGISARRSITSGMKPSGEPQRRQTEFSKCSMLPHVSQSDSFIAAPYPAAPRPAAGRVSSR
jgi:hypothetical protein